MKKVASNAAEVKERLSKVRSSQSSDNQHATGNKGAAGLAGFFISWRY